jgi:hypothetical protein
MLDIARTEMQRSTLMGRTTDMTTPFVTARVPPEAHYFP